MEKLKDILNNIKDRFANPLVFSFICSWVVINWKVVIALFWYDTKQIEKSGFNTIFDFISSNISRQNLLLYPVSFAVGYTLCMPVVKNLIRALYTWTSKWGDNWNLKILKGGMISIDKYFKFREDYDRRTQILESVIAKENELNDKYNSINTNLLEAKAKENELKQQLTETNSFVLRSTDVKMLNGHWINTYSDTIDTSLSGREEVLIEQGNYYIIDRLGERKHVFYIRNFYFDSRSKTMFFIKERIGQEKAFIQKGTFFDFRYNPNDVRLEHQDLLVGFENGTTKIKYERKEISSSNIENESSK